MRALPATAGARSTHSRYVLHSHQGAGLGKWLIATAVSHPELQGLRRFLLATRDAHGLYAQYGFVPLSAPERWMERTR